MAIRDFTNASDNLSAPSRNLAAITPHASNNLPNGVCKALYVGGAGDIAIIADDDSAAVTLVGVLAGSILPIRVKAVRTTGTTATNLVALY